MRPTKRQNIFCTDNVTDIVLSDFLDECSLCRSDLCLTCGCWCAFLPSSFFDLQLSFRPHPDIPSCAAVHERLPEIKASIHYSDWGPSVMTGYPTWVWRWRAVFYPATAASALKNSPAQDVFCSVFLFSEPVLLERAGGFGVFQV